MKYLPAAFALLATLGTALTLQAETYLRPGLAHFSFTNSHYEDETGGSLAVGTTLGTGGNHQLEFEADLVAWKAEWLPIADSAGGPPILLPGGTTTTGDGHLLPLLLGYRYRTGTADSVWRFYAGANLGATRVTGDLLSLQALPPPYGTRSASVSSWRATAGVAVGVEFRLAPHFRIDLGYRFRAVDGPTVTLRVPTVPTSSSTQDMGSLSTSVVTAGCTWSF